MVMIRSANDTPATTIGVSASPQKSPTSGMRSLVWEYAPRHSWREEDDHQRGVTGVTDPQEPQASCAPSTWNTARERQPDAVINDREERSYTRSYRFST